MLSEGTLILYVIEMLVNTFGLMVSILFLYVLTKTKLFLINQKLYLANIIIANIVTIISRYPIVIQLLFEKTLYGTYFNTKINEIHDLAGSVIVNMIGQLVIFLDVTLVVFGKADFSTITSVCFCLLQWILGELNIYLGALNIPPPLYSQALMECINFICWMAFAGLIYMGRLKYRQQTVGDVKHKYKISISLRTLAVLKVMAICSAIRNFICINVIILLYAWIRPNKDVDGERIVSFFYDLTLSFYAAAVPFLMVLNHEEMHKTYIKLCNPAARTEISLKNSTSLNETKFMARNVVGDVITPVAPDEGQFYFQQLRADWNIRRLALKQENCVVLDVEDVFLKDKLLELNINARHPKSTDQLA
ncbi:unnamed protein product [Bursaphelenchus okinawaensis]|uniref:G_PROTEIN_RECEP_F1_2 domain-containing protein n=1 Tax=Bursaphelenchus okinawaensis TaxID=465554 RepID=A0A811K5J8_9BILA|nr:unnamed protein product [Bursaphelenchus okinawaensis]CAG9091840.1 unnamed protein product [Bursaphelenchus okinawaensis]